MVLHDIAFPAFKLAALAFRQAIRPISKKVVDHGKENPAFRKYILCASGQAYNRLEIFLKLRSLDLRAPFKVPSLPDEEASKVGADLVSEVFVFVLFVSIAVVEYNRQRLVEGYKLDRIENEKKELLNQLNTLTTKMNEHEKTINDLLKIIEKLNRALQ